MDTAKDSTESNSLAWANLDVVSRFRPLNAVTIRTSDKLQSVRGGKDHGQSGEMEL
jgi:hypothetical protein